MDDWFFIGSGPGNPTDASHQRRISQSASADNPSGWRTEKNSQVLNLLCSRGDLSRVAAIPPPPQAVTQAPVQKPGLFL